jgi:AraC-like DNA-binding protein
MLFTGPFFRRLCLGRDLLADLHEGAPSVPEVALACRLSSFQFIRQFEAVFGATPHQYRTQLRIERAKALLATEQMSVTEVCLEVGFSSLGSFSDLFSRRVGASPTAYRRRLRRVYPVPDALERALAPGCFGLLAHLPPGAFRNFREAPEAGLVVGDRER